MRQVLKRTDYKKMSWANGQGETLQIDLFPQSANFPNEKFNWRLSSAKILTDCQFSRFKDYKRLLILWKGKGIDLDSYRLVLNEPFGFAGALEIGCKLISGEVEDVGLIYDPQKYVGELQVLKMRMSDCTSSITIKSGIHFLFTAMGSYQAAQSSLIMGDTLKVENSLEEKIDLIISADTMIYLFSLFPKNQI